MAKFLDESGLATLWSLIGDKHAKIATGTYSGTGTYGESNPVSLTFSFEPKVLFISSAAAVTDTKYRSSALLYCTDADSLQTNFYYKSQWNKGVYSWEVYAADDNSGMIALMRVQRSGNTVSFYNGSNEHAQLNSSGVTWRYVAIG